MGVEIVFFVLGVVLFVDGKCVVICCSSLMFVFCCKKYDFFFGGIVCSSMDSLVRRDIKFECNVS